ncbi:MAG: DUF475 domain-containing protein [Alphaproteobacteria bacterium]|nr:DUF475 domain-containing protein [Alphaproteobacteria bacterium]
MRYFLWSHLIALAALAGSYFYAGVEGLFIAALLILMEVSFSADNAVVNAVVLKGMEKKWQDRFLTWGILFAVFGVRLVFPILIVALATGLGMMEVIDMSLKDPDNYAHYLHESHVQIASFGGMFLLMVFFHFIFNASKELHWLGRIEERLARFGKLESVEVIIAMSILLVLQHFLPTDQQHPVLLAGTIGVMLYVAVSSITTLMSSNESVGEHAVMSVAYSGVMGFIYLNILDASFSLDGVIGAFAISRDIVIIMLGLGAGAMYVRSITVYLVRKGTLAEYVFLEHGAHYGIGALAIIMLTTIITPVPEYITGIIGAGFIFLSLWSSVRHNRKQVGV